MTTRYGLTDYKTGISLEVSESILTDFTVECKIRAWGVMWYLANGHTKPLISGFLPINLTHSKY